MKLFLSSIIVVTSWLLSFSTVTGFLNNVPRYASKAKLPLDRTKKSKVTTLSWRASTINPLFMSDPQGPLPAPAPEKVENVEMEMESVDTDTKAVVEGEEKTEVKELSEEEKYKQDKLEEIERLRSQEVFTKRKTGDYECKGCGWKYRESSGVGKIKAGTPFAELPQNFVCPVCKAPKPAFVELTEIVSGFEVNKQYGLFNEMTEGNKSLLIYGGLGFFFVLFLCGYLLE